MEGVQTLYFTNTTTRFNDYIFKMWENRENKRRFKIGCGVSECEMFNAIYIEEVLCKGKCYIKQTMIDKIHDYLIKKENE